MKNKSLLDGEWELRIPEKQDFTVNVTGEGKLVPAFKAKIGLLDHESILNNVRAHTRT